MVGKFWVAVMVAGVAGALALPVSSASAQPAQPAAKKPMAEKTATHHHKMSCYDYAWESQQMKDCLAKAESKKPTTQKASTTKKPVAKPKASKSS